MICAESVKIHISKLTLRVGEWCRNLTYEITPFNVTYDDLIWYSEDSNVAVVCSSNGYIYAKSPGTTRIYARTVDGSECNDYIIVTVYEVGQTESITLNAKELFLNEGESISLNATETPPSKKYDSLMWASSDIGVARVVNGTVCGISKGRAVITALAKDGSGVCGCCEVIVRSPKEYTIHSTIRSSMQYL